MPPPESRHHMRLAHRLDDIAPFQVMDILARARALEAAGRSIIHLEIGEPAEPTPEPIVAAGIAALAAGHHHYTTALGLPELRAAIARHYHERHGVTVAPERVVVTPGSSGALILALGALADAGGEVLMADPGYPCNRHFAHFLDLLPRSLPVGPESAFQLNADLLQQHWTARVQAVLLASPSNPTGTAVNGPAMAAIAALCRARGAHLIVDEIYHELIYDPGFATALALDDGAFVINSFSKYFHMTGWRLGWLVAPEWALEGIERLAQNIFLAPSTPAQYAALSAFAPQTLRILEARKAEMKVRRDYLVSAIGALGFRVPVTPQGAFYVYADCSSLGLDSQALCAKLLDEAGVALTPGMDFGTHEAHRYVRLSYTVPLDQLREAVARMAACLGRQ